MKKRPWGWILFPLCSLLCLWLLLWTATRHGQPWFWIAGIFAGASLAAGVLLCCLNRKKKGEAEPWDETTPTVKVMGADEPAERRELLVMLLLGWKDLMYLIRPDGNKYRFTYIENRDVVIQEDGSAVWSWKRTASLGDLGKYSFTIPYHEVQRLVLRRRESITAQMPNSGSVTFYTAKKRKHFALLGEINHEEIERFFVDVADRMEVDERGEQRQHRRKERERVALLDKGARQNAETMRRLRMWHTALSVLAVMAAILSDLFFPPYYFWPAAATVLMVLSLLIPMVFPAYYTLVFSDRKYRRYGTRCIDAVLLPFICGVLLLIRTFVEYRFVHEWQVMVAGLVFGILLVIPLLWRLSELKFLGQGCVIFLLLSSSFFGVVGQINGIADFHAPVVENARIMEKIERSKGSDSLVVQRPNGERIVIEVDMDDYRHARIGDWGELYYYRGALGIPYVEFWN